MVWQRDDSCRNYEDVRCVLYMDCQGKHSLLSNESVASFTNCASRRPACWSLDDNDSYNKRCECDCDDVGRKTRVPTLKQQLSLSRSTGSAVVRACFACRKYPTKKVGQKQTQWKCRHCAMPICQKDHSIGNNVDPRRRYSCLQEHQYALPGDPLYCNQVNHFTKGSTFPKEDVIHLPDNDTHAYI